MAIIPYPEILRLEASGIAQFLQDEMDPSERGPLSYASVQYAADLLFQSEDWKNVRALAAFGHDILETVSALNIPDDVKEPEPEPEPEPEQIEEELAQAPEQPEFEPVQPA